MNRKERAKDLEKEFLKKYPKKAVRGYHVPQYIDLKPIMQAMEESHFLRHANNLTLKWLVKNREKVCSGRYKDYEKPNYTQTNQNEHNYSDEELNKLFDNNKIIETKDD